MSRVPMIIVLGATGTGKSRLAVEIAKKFHGEIISADSMQVYEGLNIMSNKITEAEREGVPHYFLDICKPIDRFTVLDFRNRALTIIDDMRKRGKLPIIVGGTTYYIESILWNTLMEAPVNNPDELVSRRCRVIKEDENVSDFSRWRTYVNKGKYHPPVSVTLDDKNQGETITVPSAEEDCTDFSSINSINLSDRDITQLEKVFEESIRKSISRLQINYSHYQRTFYRMSEENQNESNVNFEYKPEVEDCYKNVGKLSTECIVRVETQLLSEFLRTIIRKFVSHLKEITRHSTLSKKYPVDTSENSSIDSIPSLIWNQNNMHKILFDSDGIPLRNLSIDCTTKNTPDDIKTLLEECNFYENSEKEDITIEFHQLKNKLRDLIHGVINTRRKRLKLIQIIDDENMADCPTEDLYFELKLLDSKTARSLHPNDRRKIIRALQLSMETGKTVKELRKEQHRPVINSQTVADDVEFDEHGLSLRYPHALVLWLRCDQDTLDKRLIKRVDEMVANGLIKELELFHHQYNMARLQDCEEKDYTKGIFQSIGLKEFHSYLMLSLEDRGTKIGVAQLQHAVERLKRTNVQYSKSQTRYIINKFVSVPDYKQVPLLFELDTTSPEKLYEEVDLKALTLIQGYLKQETDNWWSPYTPTARASADPGRYLRGDFSCTICQRLFTNQFQLNAHKSSRSHHKYAYKQKIRKLQEQMRRAHRPKPCKSQSDSDEDIYDFPLQEWNLN